jgi:hypothetical protein
VIPDVIDNVVQAKVHLIQRFLHVENVNRGSLNKVVAMAQQRSQRAYVLEIRPLAAYESAAMGGGR